MITINMSVQATKIVKRIMDNAKRDLNKRRKLNARAVLIIDKWIQKNFQQEGKLVTPGGWEKLKPSTIARRRTGKKKSLGKKILQDTGQLRSRWKHYYTNKAAKIETNVPYAIYHDSDKPRKKLPRRQILPDHKHIEKDLLKIYGKFIDNTIKHSETKT